MFADLPGKACQFFLRGVEKLQVRDAGKGKSCLTRSHPRITAPLSVFVAGESQGEWVWVDANAEVAIGARVKVTPSGQRLLVDDDGKVNTGVAQNQEVLVVNQTRFDNPPAPTPLPSPPGAQSVPGAGGLPQGHAPDAGRGRG